jgi:hypothetical protein
MTDEHRHAAPFAGFDQAVRRLDGVCDRLLDQAGDAAFDAGSPAGTCRWLGSATIAPSGRTSSSMEA